MLHFLLSQPQQCLAESTALPKMCLLFQKKPSHPTLCAYSQNVGGLHRIREGEKGARAVSLGAGSARVLLTWFLVFLLAFLLACFHVGCLLRQYCCPLATRLASEKGSRVARPQREKVPTRGFSAKKEGVWRDLSTKGLADFRRKRKRCGATSARKSADSRIFGKKGNRVARPQKSAKYSLFLCVPAQIK